MQLLANEFKRCITTSWKLEKLFVLFVTSKTQTKRFAGKWQIDNFGAFFAENKDWTKVKIG